MNYYEPIRRKVFISFHQKDRPEVDAFIEEWANRQGVFIAKALGVSDNDDFIKSTKPEYVMSQIRAKYLEDSTVTVVLIGTCTHSRRYVDWEIKASLRQGETEPNGLIGFLLPSAGQRAHLPPRFQENWQQGEHNCYARYRFCPQTAQELRELIEDAHDARTSRAHLIKNTQDMMKNNGICKVCNLTHPA
ncbi:MAG: hypothetical protein FJ387_26730 [Verrucomicrobia bacterium]|nr:hypothetical protein [Verrucomicrobiota bacterium]